MELWFWAAVLGAVLAGVSNFIFKIAAKRGFNSELFSLYGGLHSIVLTSLAIALFETPNLWSLPMVACAMLAAGGLASVAGI